MKFIVDKEIFSRYSGVHELILVMRGVNNETRMSREIIKESQKVQKTLKESLESIDWLSLPQYKLWINRYNEIALNAGHKSKGVQFLPAHVSLTKRIVSGKWLPNINPIVNFYNMLSVKYSIPAGGADFSRVYGDMKLQYCSGSELSLLIGESKLEKVLKNEVAWVDDHSVETQMWGWRQSERTSVNKGSKDIYFVLDFDSELFENGSTLTCEQFTANFASEAKRFFGVEVESYIIKKDCTEVEIDYKTLQLPEEWSSEDIKSDLLKLVQGSNDIKKGNKGITKRKAESMNLIDKSHLLFRLREFVNNTLASKFDISDNHLVWNLDGSLGELSSTVAFKIAKEVKKSPRDCAVEIAQILTENKEFELYFESAEVAPNGFINFRVSKGLLYEEMFNALLQKERFGKSNVGEGKVVTVESPAWNPNKAAHVGHLLNLFLGKSLFRMFSEVGFEPVSDDLDNDKGMPVMQSIWAYIKFGNESTPESEKLKADHFVHKFYSMGKHSYDTSDEVKEEVRTILVKWEEGDPQIRAVWKKLVNWAYKGQEETINTYGETYTAHRWHESDVYLGGKDVILENLEKGLLEKTSDGAVIARIEEVYGLPDTVLLKSNGTGLYHTQDVGLTIKKKEKFNAWRMIWLVGEEQIVHFQRLFSILDMLDIMPIGNLYHYAYGLVVDKSGKKISSRDGGDLSADELYTSLLEKAENVIKSRNEQFSDEESKNIAREIVIGAVKYAFLSKDPFNKIKFDQEEALSFTGKSGPYIMYAYTRGNGILNKLQIDHSIYDKKVSIEEIQFNNYERELLVALLRYPEVLLDSANNYYPPFLAEYLYDIAKKFSNFYEHVNVSNSSPEEKIFRAQTIQLMCSVLKNGLAVLGIKSLERM